MNTFAAFFTGIIAFFSGLLGHPHLTIESQKPIPFIESKTAEIPQPATTTSNNQATSDKNDTQTTYTNSQYGFTLTYPKDYSVIKKEEMPKSYIFGIRLSIRDSDSYIISSSDIIATSTAILQNELSKRYPPGTEIKKLTIGGFDGFYLWNGNSGIAGDSFFYFITPLGVLEFLGADESGKGNILLKKIN